MPIATGLVKQPALFGRRQLPKLQYALRMTSSSADSSTTTSSSSPQQQQHLILVGGGHAHVQVIKALNAQARPEHLKITLIDGQDKANYSGMVPACIAGYYEPTQTQLELDVLAEWAGMDFLCGRVRDIDLKHKLVYLDKENASPLSFDAISLDIGSASRNVHTVPGALEYTIPTRPINELVDRLQQTEQEWLSRGEEYDTPPHLVVIGGGAAGIELSLTVASRWQSTLHADMTCTLLDAGTELLPQESDAARAKLQELLQEKNISVRHQCHVQEITADHVVLQSNDSLADNHHKIPYTHCIWATGAGAHSLAKKLQTEHGLGATKHGWITVHPTFQSTTHPFVFAAGDCASMPAMPTPKAGIFAVRAGPVLIQNLTKYLESLRHVNGEADSIASSMVDYKPQDDFLKLVTVGDGRALGFRFGMVFFGKWVFDLKNRIDQNFMNLFHRDKLPDRSNIDRGQYDISQYDAQDNTNGHSLGPEDAATMLLRTDDDVDYQEAWKIIRHMAKDAKFRDKVVSCAEQLQSALM